MKLVANLYNELQQIVRRDYFLWINFFCFLSGLFFLHLATAITYWIFSHVGEEVCLCGVGFNYYLFAQFSIQRVVVPRWPVGVTPVSQWGII